MVLEKTLAIFGYPLGHTMSPTMHNAAAAALNVPYHFMAYEVPPDSLGDAVRGARGLGFAGVCITIPHKVDVAGMMDGLSEDARLMGAVNVITFGPGGRMTGHNTDGVGWLRSLREETGADPRGMRCLVLGAGGAARAISVKLAQGGAAHIEIRNRTPEKAADLARHIEANVSGAKAAGGPLEGLAAAAEACDLIVNTSSLGMAGDPARENRSPIPEAAIPADCICADAVYNPIETAFLKAALRRGARTVSGVGMIVCQGAEAWKMWTGADMPTEVVMRKVIHALGERNS